jgi:hypothetical protein
MTITKTTITVTVLHDNDLDLSQFELTQIAHEITGGDWLGTYEIAKVEAVPDDKVVDECVAVGNDGTFFPEYALKNFVILYRMESTMSPLDAPLAFQCQAEDTDHAEEQCENAYPGCAIVWAWQGPGGVGVQPALDDYYSSAHAN